MKLYVHDHVQQVRDLHQRILGVYTQFETVHGLLQSFADNLFHAYSIGDPRCTVEISNHHPQFIGQQPKEVLHRAFGLADAQQIIASAYGYASWTDLPYTPIDHEFERAADLLVSGEKQQLERVIRAQPELVRKRSSFGHRATLLHYAGSNGVEIWRQMVPSNISEIVEMLLEKGADKGATANFYGGQYDTFTLAKTSAHPQDAGVMEILLQSLA